jgi:hypothetical protein
MGVEYCVCSHCGGGFADVSQFALWCNDSCGRRWCDATCAETDGLTGSADQAADPNTRACAFCRRERLNDAGILAHALAMLGMTKADVEANYFALERWRDDRT